jgi:hypothetical protein
MLLFKTIHSGRFVKKIFNAKFTQTENADSQILAVSEKYLEFYQYNYDSNLQIPFLEQIFKQELFIHIYEVGILKSNNHYLLVLLTTCGLILMQYSSINNSFQTIANEKFNINSQEKDKLMNLKIDDTLGIIIAYSNTNRFFIYKFDDNNSNNKLTLLNSEFSQATGYFSNMIIFSKYITNFTNNDNILFHIKIPLKDNNGQFTSDDLYFDNEYRYIKLLDYQPTEIRNLNVDSYDNILSPFGNYLINVCKKAIAVTRLDFTPIYEIKFNDEVYLTGYNYFDCFLQLNFNKIIYVFKEDVLKKEINYTTVDNAKLIGKNFIRAAMDDYIFLYYDFNMNLILTKYNFFDNFTVKVDILNEYLDNSFFCLDSCLVQEGNVNRIYAISGFKGNSKLIKLEKGLYETRLNSFSYESVENIEVIEVSDCQFIFLSTYQNTHILRIKFENGLTNVENWNSLETIQNSKTLKFNKHVINSENLFTHISENSLAILNFSTSAVSEIKASIIFENNIVLGNSFVHNGLIYFIVYINSIELEIHQYDPTTSLLNKVSSYKLSDDICCFDFFLTNSKLILVLCTFTGKVETYIYDFTDQQFTFASNVILENNDDNQISPESINILLNKDIFVSTKEGYFCYFELNDDMTIKFIGPMKVSDDKEVLTISNSFIDSGNKIIQLYNSKNVYQLEFAQGLSDNLHIKKFKYIIKSSIAENRINFFKDIRLSNNTVLSIYQNHNTINLSTFTKPIDGNMVTDEIKLFNYNQLARRMLKYNDDLVVILVEKYDGNSLTNNMLMLYNLKTGQENVAILEEDRVKVNSLKFLDYKFSFANEENVIKYIMVSCENNKKGMLYVYKADEKELTLFNKLSFELPINDSCQLVGGVVLAMENMLGVLKIEIDDIKNFKLKFTESGAQKHFNRVFNY